MVHISCRILVFFNLILFLILTAPMGANSDVIVLKTGRRITSLSTWEEGNMIKCSRGGITFGFEKDQVKEVIRSEPPESDASSKDKLSTQYDKGSPTDLLVRAVIQQDLEGARKALQSGADVNGRGAILGGGGDRILKNEFPVIVHRVGYKPAPENNGPALLLAAKNGNYEMVKLLLEWDADVNLRVPTTIIHSGKGNFEVTEFGHTKTVNVDKWGLNHALFFAARKGHHEVIKLLLTRDPASMIMRDAMIGAIMKNDVAIAKILLDHGMDYKAKREALDYAHPGKRTFVKLLQDYGAKSPDIMLRQAVKSRDMEQVRELVPLASKKVIQWALHLAIRDGDSEILGLVLPRAERKRIKMEIGYAKKYGNTHLVPIMEAYLR